MEGKTKTNGTAMQRDTPLFSKDIEFIKRNQSGPLDLVAALIDTKQPRWLMGWRDIALRSVERTVITSAMPKIGTNHKVPLFFLGVSAPLAAAFLSCLSSLTIIAVVITVVVVAAKYFDASFPPVTAWAMRDAAQSLLIALALSFVARFT